MYQHKITGKLYYLCSPTWKVEQDFPKKEVELGRFADFKWTIPEHINRWCFQDRIDNYIKL